MTILLSERMNFDINAREVPLEIVEEAHEASQKITDPDIAEALFNELVPVLETCQPNRTFALACGMLMEKRRNVSGMLAFWSDLLAVFPDDLSTLRMMMRWYRRERMIGQGIQRTYEIFPNSHSDPTEAASAVVALSELRAFAEIDQLIAPLLERDFGNRSLRMRYIKILAQQSRYKEAAEHAKLVNNVEKMGSSSQTLLSTVVRRARTVDSLGNRDETSVFSKLLDSFPTPAWAPKQTLGTISFFTGQLGTGGAEKQLSRLAAGLQQKYEAAQAVAGYRLCSPPHVCLKHANPSSGGDFYLPQLRKSGVRTSILTEMEPVRAENVAGLSTDVSKLLDVLPTDIVQDTLKLVPFFRANNTRVAYLWQDGAIASSALAAVISGVGRIVTSFRGLPPNLRPNLSRPELKPLYRALADRAEVTFTANSQSTASAYEEWLDLEEGSIKVIPNAMLDILPEGEPEDVGKWEDIVGASSNCDKTVLGIFRFDENKRPDLWIEAAAKYVEDDPKTRFVILGAGHLAPQLQNQIDSLGLNHRIFLAGLTQHVGFWLHKCDLVMHLARMEGLPNVLIEAHLAAKPVLATPAGGTSEVVDAGQTGVLLPNCEDPTVEEIVGELAQLLNDPIRLHDMGRAARDRAESRYLLDQVLEQTVELFTARRV